MDCLDGIKQIPDHSINCVVTDPPYFQGLTHNGSSYELADLNISAYFFKALMAEIRRVLVKDYSFYFFTDWRGYAFYYPIINEFLKIKNLLVWDKGAAPGSFYNFAHELSFTTFRNQQVVKVNRQRDNNILDDHPVLWFLEGHFYEYCGKSVK